MFERKKHTSPQKRIDSLIGAGTVVDGDVTFTGGLRIDGMVHGNVVAAERRARHARRSASRRGWTARSASRMWWSTAR